jgi:hypothetical protein
MSIKQFNGAYLLSEDRILFRFNTQNQEEYRLWFTRRVTLFILAASAHLLAKKLEQKHSPDAAKALNAFEKETILESAQASETQSQAYEAGLHFPLGFDPILVMDVTCALTMNGEKLAQLSDIDNVQIDDALSIDFVLPGGANLNLRLLSNTLQAMNILLDQLRLQAGWGEAILSIKNSLLDEHAFEMKTTTNSSLH